MKEIHKYVKNPEAKKQLKDVYGIGTEATRATIIDDLIKRRFLRPQGKKKYLIPEPSAYLLIDALPDEMTYPDSTAIWEDRLHSLSEGEGTLEEFLAAQIAFTKTLCEKAWGVKMEVHGEYVCPRCKSGVLVQRKGKNGVFWGCSNYPKCRLTTDDKDGKPDMDEAKNRASSGGSRGRWSAKAPAASSAPSFAPAQVAYAESAGDAQPSAADWDELNTLFGPPEPYVPKQWKNWNDKPKYSASPMEKMGKEPEEKSKDGKPKEKILCPRCKEGHLKKLRGKNGTFWGCSNYPRCTATFDDLHGKPVLA